MVSTARAILMYIMVSLFLFFEMAVQVSPSVMAPQLMHSLNIGALGLGVMSGLYFYSYTLMQIPSGFTFDRYNPRMIIVASISVVSVGALLFAAAGNVYIGSIARLFMGFGSAFAFVSVLVVTADLFHSKYFAMMTGFTQMLAALGAMSGQLPISKMVSAIGWRPSMMVIASIGFFLALLIFLSLRYKRESKACDQSEELTFREGIRLIVRNKQTWFTALYACLLWAPMSGFASLWGVPFLMHVDGLSNHSAAFLCSLMWLGLAVASPILGYLSTAFNNRKIPLALSALLGIVSFGAVLYGGALTPFAIGIALFLAGAACSGQALSFTVVKENNPKAVRATAIAFNNMAVVISGAVFQPVIGYILHLSGQGIDAAAPFRHALLLVFIAYIISFIFASLFIRDTLKKSPQ